jgi:serine/threonine protein kinase
MSGLHTIELYQTSFNIGEEYAIQKVIGEGACSVVRSALHKPTGQKIAIKKISPFDHPMFCLRTMRELVSLRHFHHDDIISILAFLRKVSTLATSRNGPLSLSANPNHPDHESRLQELVADMEIEVTPR